MIGGLLVAKAKQQNYLHGAAIMTAGVIIMKILGALYKIPLGNMLGDDGYGLFLQAYYVYSLFLTLATAGFPVALSRMISAAQTRGLQMQARRTYRVAWWTFFVLGAVCSTVMFVFPDWLASTLINSPDAAFSIQALAPAVLLCCVTATYRGLTQGYGNMTPTTISQILEVLAKVAAGLALAAYLIKAGYDKPVAVAGAIFGVTVGSLAALLYMLIYKMRNYRFDSVAQPDVPESAGTIFKNLLSIGIPIALGSVALSLINLIDAGLCMTRLQSAVGYTYSHAKTLYGVYGKAQTLFNLPAAFITPLTVSIVPAISAKLVMNARGEAGKISEDSLRIAMAIALPQCPRVRTAAAVPTWRCIGVCVLLTYEHGRSSGNGQGAAYALFYRRRRPCEDHDKLVYSRDPVYKHLRRRDRNDMLLCDNVRFESYIH